MDQESEPVVVNVVLVAISDPQEIYKTANLFDQCVGEASSRLQRCQILKKELENLQRKTMSSKSKAVGAFERPGVLEYKVGCLPMITSAKVEVCVLCH